MAKNLAAKETIDQTKNLFATCTGRLCHWCFAMFMDFCILIRLKRKFAPLFLLSAALLPVLHGQAPLVSDQIDLLNAEQRIVLEWKMDAANQVLGVGLVVLAEGLYRDLLELPGLEVQMVADMQVQLAAALIAQRRFSSARSVLAAVAEAQRTDLYDLLLAVSTYGDGRRVDVDTFMAALDRVSADGLNRQDLPWFYLLQGLRAELLGESAQVQPAFELARRAADTAAQRAFFNSLILREELLKTAVNETLATEVRLQLEALSGTAAAYPYVREYAIILYNQGRADEGIELISRELANVSAGYESYAREQLRLLQGMLYGVDTLSGRDVLRALVREGRQPEVMAVALQLLARASSPLQRAELTDFLNVMIEQSTTHPLLGQMYYIRSQLALVRAETAVTEADARRLFIAAEADARLLLEQFPGLSEIRNVYRLLAYAALQRSSPQYRAAADFLIQLRNEADEPAAWHLLNRLIGDCYFLNGDYRNAADFYQAAGTKGAAAHADAALFLRLVTATVRAGQVESALQQIDAAQSNGSISAADRWRAEWNVAQALQANGDLATALQRVRAVLVEDTTVSVPSVLDLRLRWLEARLAWLLGDLAGLQASMDALLVRIDLLPGGAGVAAAEAALLRTEVLLLQADILIGLGDSSAGMQVLERLRTEFSESSAAERSYLTEANYHASITDFEAAQQTLLALADRYASGDLAPQALFEAGLYCERRGPAYFAEAVRVYHDLTERYPLNPLWFAARVKQGDLLRKMNDFVGAQIIYEHLIHTFPEHPHRYVAELSRADCMLALAKQDEGRLQEAALVLERLIDSPNLPIDVQAEVGYKWGFALLQRDATDQARHVFTLMVGRLLLDDEEVTALGVTGRYWMSRTLLELGTELEQQGELAEARRLYQKMVAYDLPGRTLAQSRANRLVIAGE